MTINHEEKSRYIMLTFSANSLRAHKRVRAIDAPALCFQMRAIFLDKHNATIFAINLNQLHTNSSYGGDIIMTTIVGANRRIINN